MKSQTIHGTTRLLGILGNPVAHSLSPVIHNHIFASMGLDIVYIPLCVKECDFHTAVNALRTFKFIGANVTIPYKQKIIPCCDVISPLSEKTGAVNTVFFRDGLMHGTTTDAEGFFRALEWMKHDPHGGNTVIWGNGGVARTIAYAMALDRTPESLTIVGRNKEKIAALAQEVTVRTGFRVYCCLSASDEVVDVMRKCSLLVNCTSVGMHPDTGVSPVDASLFHDKMTVFDTIYNPDNTKLLSDAEAAGCMVQNGLMMLLYQALASERLWLGRNVPGNLVDIDELKALAANPVKAQNRT
jgi:shikimate dehydrogenase